MAEMETVEVDLKEEEGEGGLPSAVFDLLDTAVLTIRVNETDCRCVTANRAFSERYAGGADVRGRTPSEVIPPAPAALLEAAARRAVNTGERWRYADVAEIDSATVEVLVAPLPGIEGLVAWAATETASVGHERHDGPSEQASHLLEEANAELSRSNTDLAEFAYVASHDLTEPLRMVASHLDFLRARCNDVLDEQALRSIDFAVEGAERMRALVDALLELAQVSTQPVVRTRVALAEVVEDVLDDLEPAIREAGAKVTVGVLPVLRGDRKTITSLVANLVSNALKFRSEVPVHVRIDADRSDGGWRVRVGDNGVGIKPEHRAQVFEMFRRLQPRSKHAGTGMGLAICRRVVERHGGEIAVEANAGGGTVFTFTLPDGQATS